MSDSIKQVKAEDVTIKLGTVEDPSPTDGIFPDDPNELGEEIINPTDKPQEPETKLPNDDISMLRDKLLELEKANNGLRQAITSERAKRQDYQSKVDAVMEMVNARKTTKITDVEPEVKLPDKIQIEFDDDGNAILPVDQLLPFINSKTEEKIAPIKKIEQDFHDLSTKIYSDDIAGKETGAFQNFLKDNGLENEYGLLKEQFTFLDQQLQKYIEVSGIELPQHPDPKVRAEQFIDMIVNNDDIVNSFKSKYKNADPELSLEAMFSNPAERLRNPRKLKSVLTKLKQPTNKDVDITPLYSKPKSLSHVPGSDIDGGSILGQVASMSTDEFMLLSDAEIAKIDAIFSKG